MRRRVMLSGLCLSAVAPAAASALSPSTFMVFFPAGSVKPYPQAETTLGHCVKAYRNRLPREANVEICGHTDSAEASMALSQGRAQAVWSRLVALGIPAERMRVIGLGDERLLVQTPPGAAEPQNRRVEFWLT